MKDVVEAFYQYAEDYDKWFDTPTGKVLFRTEVEAVRLLIKDQGLDRPFLEIGVGTGRFAKELGIDSGVDPSNKVLEIAKKRGIKVKEARGEQLPFKDESFGAVFLLFTLCFVQDTDKVFSEAKRVLKPDGALIIGMINKESLWGRLYLRKKVEGHPIYKYASFYSIPDVLGMLVRAGMTVEAYSSTLRQPPSETPLRENVHEEFIENAGFVCMLARKIRPGINNHQ